MTATPQPLEARRWIVHTYGDFNNLKLENFTVPPPGPTEVRISVRAVGMNFADCFTVLGLYDEAGPAPITPGFETCGVVESVGSDVTAHAVGDRVIGLKRFSCYATVLNVEEDFVRPLRKNWSFAEGASFLAQAFTAWYALCVLGAMPISAKEQSRHVTSARRAVLVHSAAGGVGLQLVEMVRHIGGIVVCTVGNEEKAKLLKDRCGIPRERVIVRGVDDATDGLEKVVRERALAGEGGLDVVVDSVLGRNFEPGYNLLNTGGRYIVMGAASLMPRGGLNMLRPSGWRNLITLALNYLRRPRLDLAQSINDNKSVSGFNVSGLFSEMELVKRGFAEVDQMELPRPLVGRKFAFEDVREAMVFFQSGKSKGKLVLEVSGGEE